MCGIAGFIHLNQEVAHCSQIRAMTSAIAHRGPDGEGDWVEENVGIGHRRLSIVDLSDQAKQPMMSANQRFVLTYNGELYNYKELKAELIQKGISFISNSDTEVVLNSLCYWGERAIEKFNGMFALGLWDREEKTLLLARDRYGVKPLYYSNNTQVFCFSSEQKGIWAHDNCGRNIDLDGITEYFTFQNIFTDRTFDTEIKMFPAGHYAKFRLRNGKLEQQWTKYWEYHFSESNEIKSYDEYKEELELLIRTAVKRQMTGDVEIGAYLSGGLDSGTLCSLASENLTDLKTFTCGFDLSSASGIELGFDERKKAEFLSYYLKTEHYQVVLKSGDMERCMESLVFHLEEPRVGQSYPNYYAAKLASKFVKVTLAGTGSDELFGGYPWRYYRALNCRNFEEYTDNYYSFWQRLIRDEDLAKVFYPIKDKPLSKRTSKEIFKKLLLSNGDSGQTPEQYINSALNIECRTFLHGLLVVEDKLSMAHGLETRVPFLDNDIVEFAMKCPVKFKLNNLKTTISTNENEQGNKSLKYYQKTKDGKKILRDVMSQYIPKKVTNEIKQGFSAPDASWFKGESIDYVKDIIFSPSSKIYNFMDRRSIENLVTEHLSGKLNRRLLIWSLIYFENYLRIF